MLSCPRCLVPLGRCACAWPERDGVTDLYLEAADAGERPEITAKVRLFYEEHPFPDYRDADDLGALVRAGRANGFLRALDQGVPPGARVVEVGCGTGQLTNFLAAGGREVLDEPRRYLDALIRRVGEVFTAGTSLLDALDQVNVAGFEHWYGYAIWHRRNVHFAYLHREELDFGHTAAEH